MPRRLTERQARFVAEYLENGGQGAKAYRVAYPNSVEWVDNAVRVEACRLLKNPLVRAELDRSRESIAEMTEAAVERVVTTAVERVATKALVSAQITADVILAELDKAYKVAEERGNAAAMVQAALGRAKVVGLLIERQDVRQTIVSPEQVQPDLAQLYRATAAARSESEPTTH